MRKKERKKFGRKERGKDEEEREREEKVMRKKNRSSVRSNILTFSLNGNCVFIQTVYFWIPWKERERSERKREKEARERKKKKGEERNGESLYQSVPKPITVLVYANCIQITPGSNARMKQLEEKEREREK